MIKQKKRSVFVARSEARRDFSIDSFVAYTIKVIQSLIVFLLRLGLGIHAISSGYWLGLWPIQGLY